MYNAFLYKSEVGSEMTTSDIFEQIDTPYLHFKQFHYMDVDEAVSKWKRGKAFPG